MSRFTVALGGHSNLPEDILDIPETDITICKLRGAKLSDFWVHARYKPMREDRHDLAIHFLGGNDVKDNCNPNTILNYNLTISKHLQQLNKNVVIITLEPREYREGNRFGVSPITYRLVSNSINKNLCKLLKIIGIRILNINAQPFRHGHSREGVHFTPVTSAHISLKITNCIKHHMN